MLASALKKCKNNSFFLSMIVILYVLWAIYNAFFWEKWPIHHGLGEDSPAYFDMLSHFSIFVWPHQLPIYNIQRLLPIFFVFLLSKIFHFQINTPHDAIFLFSVYNILVLSLAILLLHCISCEMRWGTAARIFAFSGLFFNFCVLKTYGYNPVVTDPSALTIGLLIYYFFITKKRAFLFFTSIVSGFIYPVVIMLMGLCLFFFSGQVCFVRPQEENKKTNNIFYFFLIILSAVFFFLGVTSNFYPMFHTSVVHAKQYGVTFGNFKKIFDIFLSIFSDRKNLFSIVNTFVSAIFLFFYFKLAFKDTYRVYIALLLQRLIFFRIACVFLLLLATHYFIVFYSNGQMASPYFGVTLHTFILNVGQDATLFPLVFLVSHIIYFGPIICCCLIFWKNLQNYAIEKNIGLFFLLGFYVFFATNSESRQSTEFFPILVIMITDMLHKRNIYFSKAATFFLISFIESKVWLPLNHGIWPTQITNDTISHFPMQWVFMNMGEFLIPVTYCIDLIIASTTFFFIAQLFLSIRRNNAIPDTTK